LVEAINILVAVAEAVNVLVAVAVAEAVNVAMIVQMIAPTFAPMVVPVVLRGYESEGKWMSLFRDMIICVFCVNIAR